MAEPTAAGAPRRPRVRFGIFDWLDQRPAVDLATLFDERLRLVEYADRAGFTCYHLAEHHWTPLGMAPSPSLFLSAVAQHTRRIRLGPMVYVLPLYHPLRLLEEVCMLDHLSHGRLEIGVGRGASPYELAPFGVRAEEARPMFEEALAILVQGLATGEIDHAGRYFVIKGLRAVHRPYQRPYPPLWYPTNYPNSVAWVGRHGFSLLFGSIFHSLEANREQFALYHRERAAHRDDPAAYNRHVAEPYYGLVRHVYVAETDAAAERDARAAFGQFMESFGYLWQVHGDPRFAGRGDWDRFVANGGIYYGAPATVRARLEEMFAITGANYFAGAFAFGSLTSEQALRSLRLFAEEVAPAFTVG